MVCIFPLLEFNDMVLFEAFKGTVKHRETTYTLDDISNRVNIIEFSEILKDRWIKYSGNYSYAGDITYEDTIDALKKLIDLVDKDILKY